MRGRKGKIARLPFAIREEVNRRLLEGQAGSKILPWLNELPDVKQILEEDFEGLRVSDRNLSEWRAGGFSEWLARRERLDETKELAKFSADLARSRGGSISDGAAAIAAGKLMGLLEGLSDQEKPDAEELETLSLALARIRKGDHTAQRLSQLKLQLSHAAEALALEEKKFQRQTCELFLKWRDDDRARNIADGAGSHADKIEALGAAMFGELWTESKPAALSRDAAPG